MTRWRVGAFAPLRGVGIPRWRGGVAPLKPARHGRSDAPLEVIDRCRIRRGRVLQLCGDDAIVLTDRISFDSGMLTRGGQQAGTTERVRLGEGGRHPCGPVLVGDTVAIHWDRVCEVLSPSAQVALSRGEAVAMDRANRALSVPGTPELG